jgi:mandelate racemase
MHDTDIVISSVDVRTVNAPLERPVRTAVGAVESAPLVLIDIATEQGTTGRAYIFGYTPVTLAPLKAFLDGIAGRLTGRPVAPAGIATEFEQGFRLLGRQGLVGMALSGLDMALWDVLGRALDVPVVRLLGGEPMPVPAYDSYGVVDPVADSAALEASLVKGFRAIKIKIGDGDLARDVATVSGVRRIIGPDVALMVDFNQSRTAVDAVARLNALAEFNLAWVEEPVPAEDLEGHARVREATSVPVQTGENWWFPADMAHAIAAGACDYAMPDLMKIGGITGWLRAMGQAEAASIPMSSHLFIEASAHVLPVTPTRHWLEFLDIAGAILAERPQVVDGCVTATGPGLGMQWDVDAVARYAI